MGMYIVTYVDEKVVKTEEINQTLDINTLILDGERFTYSISADGKFLTIYPEMATVIDNCIICHLPFYDSISYHELIAKSAINQIVIDLEKFEKLNHQNLARQYGWDEENKYKQIEWHNN